VREACRAPGTIPLYYSTFLSRCMKKKKGETIPRRPRRRSAFSSHCAHARGRSLSKGKEREKEGRGKLMSAVGGKMPCCRRVRPLHLSRHSNASRRKKKKRGEREKRERRSGLGGRASFQARGHLLLHRACLFERAREEKEKGGEYFLKENFFFCDLTLIFARRRVLSARERKGGGEKRRGGPQTKPRPPPPPPPFDRGIFPKRQGKERGGSLPSEKKSGNTPPLLSRLFFQEGGGKPSFSRVLGRREGGGEIGSAARLTLLPSTPY